MRGAAPAPPLCFWIGPRVRTEGGRQGPLPSNQTVPSAASQGGGGLSCQSAAKLRVLQALSLTAARFPDGAGSTPNRTTGSWAG